MTAFIQPDLSNAEKESVEKAPTTLERRRQVALELAEACSQILKQDFDVDEVIVFGSLRGDTPWHCESDLDLAVRGLDKDRLLVAHERLREIVPEWLPFDLVAVDRADERVRDRILQITPMPENKYLALKLRLEDEIIVIGQTIATLEEVLAQANTSPKILLTPALASYSEDFYSGCERLAERVVVTLDDGLPTGKAWHKQLLLKVAKPGSEDRPPLWDQSLLRQLDQYRTFRHRVRHLYNIDLDDDRVLAMAQNVPAIFAQVEQSVVQFGL